MTPQELMHQFGTLADAPGGIDKLRTLVLDLSIRGRLTDEGHPARISERTKDNREPFDLPSSWVWRRVEDVGELKLGRQRSPKNHTGPHMRPYLRVANVFEARIDTSDILKMNFDPEEAKRFALAPNDVLLNEGQSTELVGRPAIYRGEVPGACFQNTLIRFRPHEYLTSEYALVVFRAYMRIGRFVSEAQQTTNMAHLSLGRLAAIEFPLPPLAEQKRIVARVDQLMALLDDLETKQGKRHKTVVRATTACLDAMTTADSPEAVADAWKRVAGDWPVLFDRHDGVGDLRGAIRDLSIRGRLLHTETSGPDARELLRQIDTARRALSNGTGIGTFVVEQEDEPFELPERWSWTRVGALCHKVADGPHFSPKYVSAETGVPFLSARNIRAGGFDLSDLKYVSRTDHQRFCERVRPRTGDVLLTKGGTTGLAVVNTLDFEFSVWVHVAVLQVDKTCLFPQYIALALNSPHCYAQSQKLTHGTGNRDLGLTRMVNITVPLPPLSEQKLIVAKVDQLMALCDDLEAKLRQRNDRAGKLVAAVVGEIVGADRGEGLVSTDADTGDRAETPRTRTAKEPMPLSGSLEPKLRRRDGVRADS